MSTPGELYRLGDPSRSASAVQYVTADGRESVVLVYLEAQQYDGLPAPIRLRGLDEHARYSVNGSTVTGGFLMGHGITPALTGDYASTVVHLHRT